MTLDRKTLRWNGWGFNDHHHPHSPRLWSFLADALGLQSLPDTPAVPLAEAKATPSTLSFGDVGPFQKIGCELRSDAADRAFHARGDSYRDLLDLRAGRLDPVPDAILYPKDGATCLKAVQTAAELGIAVVPFGGGTSVVGGVSALKGQHRAVVAIDTTKLNALISVDKTSLTARAEAGIYGPFLEQKLNAEGVTLGHYPQSFEFSTLGGWIAARGAGQQSNRYGRAEDWLVSARLATPSGAWSTEGFPASGAGPRLTDLVAGSEGTLGIITDATFRVHTLPAAQDFRAYLFRSFEAGREAVRAIVQAGLPVSMLRLSDEDETRFYQALGRLQGKPRWGHRFEDAYLKIRGFGGPRCALITAAEGDHEQVLYTRTRVAEIARRHGALVVGQGPALKWKTGRFQGPYLRDPLMDRGLGVDTLETAASWADLPRVYAAVRKALLETMEAKAVQKGARGICLAHISHSYADGASLYFTYVWPRAFETLEGEIAQWQAIKNAASEAIVAHGGTISHHHGVGTDHAKWLPAEKGAAGMEVLRGLKRSLDPTGIMNPGKLGL